MANIVLLLQEYCFTKRFTAFIFAVHFWMNAPFYLLIQRVITLQRMVFPCAPWQFLWHCRGLHIIFVTPNWKWAVIRVRRNSVRVRRNSVRVRHSSVQLGCSIAKSGCSVAQLVVRRFGRPEFDSRLGTPQRFFPLSLQAMSRWRVPRQMGGYK